MNFLLMARLGFALAIAAGGFGAGIYAASNHYKPIIARMNLDAEKAARIASEAVSAKLSENDLLKTKLGVQHAEATRALNILLDTPAQRVLIPTACVPAAVSDSDSAAGVTVQAPATERADSEAQVALDRFTQGLESDAAEWSRALNACEVVMEWSKGIR